MDNKSKLVWFIPGVMVIIFFGIALYIRIVLPYDHVFVGDWIKFTGNDAWYHMRIVDNLVHNFPTLNSIDPYLLYKTPMSLPEFAFFDYLLAFIIWLIGLGSPALRVIDVVGVYFPAVLGALAVIPVYFIGKELFNRWAGVIAAGLIAISPGEFLGRSALGYTDHHVAEVLFSTVFILFLIMAIKTARNRSLGLKHFKQRDWAILTRPVIYSLLAGVFLGIFLITWLGSLLFVFIITLYFAVQFIIDHLNNRNTDYLFIMSTITFLVTLLILITLVSAIDYIAALIIALLLPVVLGIVSRLVNKWGLKAVFYPVILIGIGLVGLAIWYLIAPNLLMSMLNKFSILNPVGARLTTLEAGRLFFPSGEFSLTVAWGNFTTGLYLSFISLAVLIYLIIKHREADLTLFVVWSLAILLITLLMRRFAYYFAVNVALLTGYISWLILRYAGFEKAQPQTETIEDNISKKAKKRKNKKDRSRNKDNILIKGFGVVLVFFLVFFPNIKPAITTASTAAFAPKDAWCETLYWMRDNTPEPFGDPESYYELYREPLNYPDTAYSVAAWWDYGYWITRMAHRIPITNPGSGFREVAANFFVAQDEASALKYIDGFNSKYVVLDMDMVTSKFHGVASYADLSSDKFFEVYYQAKDNSLRPVMLFYPEYYQAFAIRLFNFDGARAIPQDVTVVSYREQTGSDGVTYKLITDSKVFHSYQEAVDFVNKQNSGNYRIVGTNPFISIVPMEPLEHYELIYNSTGSEIYPDAGRIPMVKVFEYKDSGD